jgi:hypothetical protein
MDKLELLKDALTLGVESQQNAKEQIETIKDSLAVIEWYSAFVHTKLLRAVMSQADEDLPDDFTNDANGSAKTAVIGIERSMKAWVKIFALLPAEEDHFLNVLAMLEKLKNETLTEFPEAMRFVRPGFDEEIV